MSLERTNGRVERRRVGVAATAVALVVLMLVTLGGQVFSAWAAQIDSTDRGEVPTTGGMRPGPVGQNPPPQRSRGVLPVAIRIEAAQVDSEVEIAEIVGGVMQNPTGPNIVAWYRGTGRLGEVSNVVMSGHVDFHTGELAVFRNLAGLQEGDKIEVTGENGITYTYVVEWLRNYDVASLDQAAIDEIVGETDSEVLTLITCSGTFDPAGGGYDNRFVVRARREG